MNVPCNGCTICCRVDDAIQFMPDEDAAQYKTVPLSVVQRKGGPRVPVPGRLMLERKSSGECVYVAYNGCSIWERRPRMCREFDCRESAKRFGFTEARTRGITMIWQRGKHLLREAA